VFCLWRHLLCTKSDKTVIGKSVNCESQLHQSWWAMWIKGSNYLGCLFLLVSSAAHHQSKRADGILYLLSACMPPTWWVREALRAERGGEARSGGHAQVQVLYLALEKVASLAVQPRIASAARQFLSAHVSPAPHTESGFSPDYQNVSWRTKLLQKEWKSGLLFRL
jgi:hypothetical protein